MRLQKLPTFSVVGSHILRRGLKLSAASVLVMEFFLVFVPGENLQRFQCSDLMPLRGTYEIAGNAQLGILDCQPDQLLLVGNGPLDQSVQHPEHSLFRQIQPIHVLGGLIELLVDVVILQTAGLHGIGEGLIVVPGLLPGVLVGGKLGIVFDPGPDAAGRRDMDSEQSDGKEARSRQPPKSSRVDRRRRPWAVKDQTAYAAGGESADVGRSVDAGRSQTQERVDRKVKDDPGPEELQHGRW